MKKIGFLVSGNGGTLKFLYLAFKELFIPCEIIFVIGDRDCGAIKFGRENKISTHVINYKLDNTQELIETLDLYRDVDVIITNIHKIIHLDILKKFEDKFINLHYSLLPAYKGLIGMKTIEFAKRDNTMMIGATCHEVSEDLDGGRILCQSCFAVNWENDSSNIHNTVFRSANFCLLNTILLKLNIEDKDFTHKQIKGILYNPPLRFNTKKIDKFFWKKVSE